MQTTHDTQDLPSGKGLRFAIVIGEWHKEHSLNMLQEARALLVESEVEVFWAPGALETPIIARALAKSSRFAAILAFGVVVRGDTRHFEMVADGATQGLMAVALETGVPVLNEIIAAENMQQVVARTQPGPANKGREGAIAALKVAALLRGLAQA